MAGTKERSSSSRDYKDQPPVVIPAEVLETLKCVECKNYLSVGPIFHMDNGYLCGRCRSDLTIPKRNRRALEIEGLCKVALFPCQFDTLGCKEVGKFDEILEHEQICQFLTIFCPICSVMEITELDVKVERNKYSLEEMFEHFQADHNDFVLPNATFELQESSPYSLLVIKDHPFFLQRKQEINAKVDFKVAIWSLKSLHCGLSYQLEAFGQSAKTFTIKGNKNVSGLGFICKDGGSFQYEDHFINLNLSTISSVLGIPVCNIKFKITVSGWQSTPDMELLLQLQCPVCQEIMHPPIYTCVTGHSICCHCHLKIDKWPTCQSKYMGTCNFTLENMTRDMNYKCHYKTEGCTFEGLSSEISTHEDSCAFKKTCCPKCRWKGSFSKLHAHLKRHTIQVVEQVSLTECYQWRINCEPTEVTLRANQIVIHQNKLLEVEILLHLHEVLATMKQLDVFKLKNWLYEFEIIFKNSLADYRDSISI